MIHVEDKEYFSQNVDYEPVVGDSVTGDTPLFIKYNKTGLIDIVPISELIDENSVMTDHLGREYDLSPKKFKVLCRSGWVIPQYLYRHKTDKRLYRVENKSCGLILDCTEDHSLFNESHEKIKPSEIDSTTKLEPYEGNQIQGDFLLTPEGEDVYITAILLVQGKLDKIPTNILNGDIHTKKLFVDEVYRNDVKYEILNKTTLAGLNFIEHKLAYPNNEHIIGRSITCHSHEIGPIGISNYVYDISLDGTFVNALGINVICNTDGVNFVSGSEFRYTDEHPYFATGRGRNGKVGVPYTGVAADVQEFEDIYLVPDNPLALNKMGVDIDECIPGNGILKRKLYFDLIDDGSVKLVGNSLKSKTLSKYIETFINKGVKLLLYGHGKEFIDYYYDYIETIYNFKIPLASIASVGKIKITLDEYKEKCKELTAGGTKKSRQAWYELAIKNNLKVNLGDSIYYINTGKKKTDSDVQRVTKYFTDFGGVEVDVTKDYKKEHESLKKAYKVKQDDERFAKYLKENGKFVSLSEYMRMEHPDIEERDELIFNCVLVPNELIEDEEDHFCNEEFEYNVAKYIAALNARILNLTVCFDRKMRERVDDKGKVVSNILIDNPKDRKFFTEEECELISGQPLNESDQDKLEDVLMPEDKEIRFWTSINEKPPYADECGLDWEAIKADYFERQAVLQQEGIKQEYEQYQKILSKMKDSEIDEFLENGTLPDGITKICSIRTKDGALVSKQYNTVYGFLTDIVDLADEFKPEDYDEDNGPDE